MTTSTAPLRPVFRAGRQLAKLRLLLPLMLVAGALFVAWGVHTAFTLGTRPADGGVLAPLPLRLLSGGLMAAFGLAAMAGMTVFARCYVAAIDARQDDGPLEVRVAGVLGGELLLLSPEDVLRSTYHPGVLHTDGVSVDAPWFTLRLRGRRLPLVLDVQGEVSDPALMVKLAAPGRRRG
jgi:hypothetical protein